MKRYYLLMLLVCLLGNNALAQNGFYATETIDFSVVKHKGNPEVNFRFNNDKKPMINNQVVSDRIIVDNTDYWGFWGSDAYLESYLQKDPRNNTNNVYLSGLNVDDIVTIWGEVGNNEGNVPGAFNITSGATLLNTTYFEYNGENIPNSKEYKITEKGTATIQFDGNYSGLRKITITSRSSHFDYDPGYEEYDMYDEFSENDPDKTYNDGELTGTSWSTSYTLSDEETGFTLNGKTAKYIVLDGSKISANNRIAIDSDAGTWRFNYGLRAPDDGKWANFSVCNLKVGDRVVFSYTGTAPVFSSEAGGAEAPTGPYNGSEAFGDQYNDGIFDAGEDVYITSGSNPEIDWQRGEGNIYQEDHNGNNGDYQLYYTQAYVITEDGHLDLAIAPDTRIVKLKIYSDHQATMVDVYNSRNYTYSSKFDITGELQAKEHIVPGGLEVHVGSDDASQHAHVVRSTHGPVAVVNAVDGFKIPGMSRNEDGELEFEFDLANKIPETGTFYRFIPLESGKMQLTFQAASMNYYRYDLNGDAVYHGHSRNYTDNSGWTEQFDRPNEQTRNVTCPYYLVKVDENDNATFTKIADVRNGFDYQTQVFEVEVGNTYYLYGGWNVSTDNLSYTSSGQGNNNLEYFPSGAGNGGTDKACGVARLLEIQFEPVRKIYPLAKWVPNGTTGVYEESSTDRNGVPNPDNPSYAANDLEYDLAYVEGYNNARVTIKKMTGNITGCEAYIKPGQGYAGRLMIKNITFDTDKDPGGTILIKIGDPDIKSNPVYTLTIAYSTDPQYDGKIVAGTRGHSWDFSSSSLHGLDWATTNYAANGAQPADYGHYFENYFDSSFDVNNYSSANDVWETLAPSESGLLYKEIIEGTSDWMFNYNLVNAGKLFDPVFMNKYDLEGDNADLIWETEGTVFKTSANQSVMFNEFTEANIHQSTIDPDRYVGIREGGEFRIPWLRKNDRVIIYMGVGKGAFNNQAVFSIKNAYDAVHNEIDPDDEYIIGGSQWNSANSDNYYRGCYHFFATGDKKNAGKPADMIFKMTGGNMCKIYSIQIYRGDRINTNEVVGETSDDKFLLWSRTVDPNDEDDEAATGSTYNWTLKYFGKDQKLANGKKADNTTGGVNNDIVAWTGTGISTKTLTTSTVTDPTQPTYNTFTFVHDNNTIGTFRARGKDMEKNMKYVADYGEHNVTVALQQTMEYPYTWDLMDLTGWSNNATRFINEDAYGSSSSPTYTWPEWFDSKTDWDASYEKSSKDLSLFGKAVGNDQGYVLRLNSQETASAYPQDNIFESVQTLENNEPYYGNQLWTDGRIVPESQGLWFHTPTQNTLNGSMRIYDDGMSVGGNPSFQYNMVVPNVPAGAVVYMRIKKAADYLEHKYKFAGSAASDLTLTPVDPTATSPTEWVASIKNNNSEKKHLTLSFVGYTLEKLAVSMDSKSIGKTGFATESRARVIDHELTEYFTLAPVKAYQASFDNDEKPTKVILSQIRFMPAAPDLKKNEQDEVIDYGLTNNEGLGCILYHDVEANSDESIGKSVTGGFHLFVPDMHDNETDLGADWRSLVCDTETNILRSCVPAAIDDNDRLYATDNGDTRYILSAQPYYNAGEGYQANDGGKAGLVGFYKVDPLKGAKKTGNIAYMQLSSGQIPQAKMSMVFFDELTFEDNNGTATAIDNASNEVMDNDYYYTLSGLRVNQPKAGGIYIKNGKKVVVK